jgi:predicted PurR-regulated permease PerM
MKIIVITILITLLSVAFLGLLTWMLISIRKLTKESVKIEYLGRDINDIYEVISEIEEKLNSRIDNIDN